MSSTISDYAFILSVSVRPVSVEGLRDLKLKVKEQLTLVCKCKGNPLPLLQWYKDGVHIRASKRTKIQYKK